MSTAQNEVDICNLALDYLNVDPISTITDPTDKIGKLCARWYDNTRKSVLRMHTWNFAMKRATLAKDTAAPLHGYTTQYTLPSDYIRIVSVGEDNCYQDYGLEGRKLLLNDTDSTGLKIRYVYNSLNVEQYDPLFVELFALSLAYNISYPLSGNINVMRTVKDMLDEKMRAALGVDGQERKPRRRERSRFKEARMKYGNYGSPFLED